MIVSYRDSKTKRFANGERIREFSGFARQAEIRLDRLDAAASLKDLAALPGNRLEALKGDRQGQYSMRINDQWRICFEWPEGLLARLRLKSSIIIRRAPRNGIPRLGDDQRQEKTSGTHTYSPGRTPRSRTERTSHVCCRTGSTDRRPGEPHYRDH
ncbi:MAG TPA: type II toxin-antitoxin system RelE/ParE family toxin [Xanthobacteraceae bacterium]|nr:type II toxin-antitoxin system RelE/ParE family toxin [Xanthobacteraceae bacterium]